jgi:transcriptional regulator with XRE-family HTH domain
MPAIIEFLGYNPLPEAVTMGETPVRQRTTLGLTMREAAERPAVDAGTLARWERGEREPAGAFLSNVERLLRLDQPTCPTVRRAG